MCVHSRKAFASANCNYLLGKVSAYLSSQSEEEKNELWKELSAEIYDDKNSSE